MCIATGCPTWTIRSTCWRRESGTFICKRHNPISDRGMPCAGEYYLGTGLLKTGELFVSVPVTVKENGSRIPMKPKATFVMAILDTILENESKRKPRGYELFVTVEGKAYV